MSQDILITPKIGEPQILFRGSGTTDTPIALNVLSSYQSATGSGTAIVFEGTQGQLFGVTDNLSSGTIFSVSDITGLPSLEFLANGELKLGEFGSGVNVYSQNFGVTLSSTGSVATHIPVFIADPSSSVSRLYHRTAAQLRSDIGAGSGNGTVTSVATNNGVTGGAITTTGTIGLTGNALSLHNLATNGVIARTAANTVTARTITGTANQVTVTNGDGVAGNPTLALPQNIHTAATPTFSSIVLTGSIGAEDSIRVTNGRIQLGPATFGAGVWLDRTSSQRYWFVGMDASDGTTLRFFRGSDRLLLDLNGNATLNANLNLRAPATGVAATQIPVFTADPASTTRLLVTRTPAQLRADIGAGTGDGTVTSIATNNGITGGTITGTGTIGLTGNALSLHNLSTNGVIARTAANTVTARTITGTANQVTVTNGDGVAGNPTLSLPQNIHTAATPTFSGLTVNGSIGIRCDSTLATVTHVPAFTGNPSSTQLLISRPISQFRSDIGAGTGTVTSIATNNGITGGTITETGTIGLTGNALSLHNLATNGVIARTAANTVTARTITGTANQVTVTNGDGVAGNPTLALPQNIHTAATPTFGGATLDGSLNLRAAATGVAATQIPVFTADPASTTRLLVTRTPSGLREDMSAVASIPVTNASGVVNIMVMSEATYNALSPKNANTLYFLT